MSLDLKKSLELQRFVLGERPEVRNCRFDNINEDKLVARSASAATTMTTEREVVIYNDKPSLTTEQMLELQRKIIEG
jgi:hypothetical protein